MKEHDTLYKTYTDLLTEQADPELVQVIRELDSIGNAAYPPANVNWTRVRALHAEQTFEKRANILPFRAGTRQWHPLLHKAALVPALTALVLITAAFTYALTLTPLLHSMLSGELLNDNLFVGIHGSQTVDGLTFNLEAGYADSEQVIIGYRVTPVTHYINPVQAELSTQDGIQLPALSGGTEADKYELGNVWTFDSSGITGNPKTLDFQLKLKVWPLPITSGTPTTVTAQQLEAERAQGTPLPTPTGLRTATFNFSLPFHPGKIVASGLQATSHGQTITLEQVGVSKSATRVVIKGLGPQVPSTVSKSATPIVVKGPGSQSTEIWQQGPSTEHVAFLTLQVPGARGYHTYPDLGQDRSETSSYFYFNDFSQNHGTWTLTITEGANTWVFHFVVPA